MGRRSRRAAVGSRHVAPPPRSSRSLQTTSFLRINRVEDLHALVTALKAEGCNVLDKIDDSDYGKFAWVIDPEGNKVELWQPPPPPQTSA